MKKQYTKYFLDLIMTLCFICIMKIKITGMHLHEILGLWILIFVIIHNLLNFKWIKSVSKKLFDESLNTRTKISCYLNMILAVLVTVTVVSGLLVSVTIFRNITTENRELWANVHKISALLTFIGISIHVGLHWKMIMHAFRTMFKIKGFSAVRQFVLRAMSIIIIALGIVSLSNNYILKNIFNINDTNEKKQVTKLQAVIEYASVMGLFVGGTYYTFEITTRKKQKN